MDSSSGFGANGAPYEYAVSEAKSGTLRAKKIALVAAYVLWGVLLLAIGLLTRLLVPLLALVPLSIWILVFLTWRYTQVEYEYSFFSGKLTVARILGGRTRKVLTEVTIRELSQVFPYTEENLEKAERFGAEETWFAASGTEAPDLYVALWEDKEREKKCMLCFNANEKAIRILRYYNVAALAK